MASLRWKAEHKPLSFIRKTAMIRGRSARLVLHMLAERPADAQKRILRAARQARPSRITLQEASDHRLQRMRLPHRFAAHMLLIMMVGAVIWGDSFQQWSALQLEPRTNDQAAIQALPATFWRGEAVRSIAPVDTSADTLDLEQIAPVLQMPRTIVSPIFARTHTLALDETLADIAAANRISVESLVWANGLQNDAILAVGRELRIPRLSGVPHVVAPGETTDGIAELYGVPVEAIELLDENGVEPDAQLDPGTELFIPNAQVQPPEALLQTYGSLEGLAAQPARFAAVVREAQTNVRAGPGRSYERVAQIDRGWVMPIARYGSWIKIQINGEAGWILSDLIDIPQPLYDTLQETNDFPPPPVVWVWPARGALTSGFGPRWGTLHNGIDIANRARTPIVAARAGTVYEAGWCSGFGYCVKINHGDGVETIYGHLFSKPAVSAGEQVSVGQYIGAMGSTYDARGGGYSTGVHLHFTVKVNGRTVDPLKYLP